MGKSKLKLLLIRPSLHVTKVYMPADQLLDFYVIIGNINNDIRSAIIHLR